MAIINAWHLHKKHDNTIDQLVFRRSIAITILEQNKKEFVFQRRRPRQMLELRYEPFGSSDRAPIKTDGGLSATLKLQLENAIYKPL